MEIEVGGAILELPDEASEEAIQKAVKQFRRSPEFDKMIDRQTGAPARVRTIVGGAPLQDRLVNIQRFYPDAIEYGDDNFVFTDPGTGRPTLYNPEGLDLGDVASVGREISQTIGAGLGAVAGAPGGPPGVAAGAGLGSATAGTVYDVSQQAISGGIDTRTLAEHTVDTSMDALGGAVGQRGGELLSAGVKKALGGGGQAISNIVEKFAALRIEPPAGAVSGGATAITTKMLEVTPTSAGTMRAAAEKTLEQAKAAAERIARTFGRPGTPQEAGETIRQAAIRTAERFNFRQEKLYDEAYDLIGADTPVAVESAVALRETLEAELSRAPESLRKALSPAINMLKALEEDATDGVAFSALRQVRTMIGKDIANPMLSGSTGAQNEALKRIYGALSDDLAAAAREVSPEAAKKLATADRYTRVFMTQSAKTMQKIADFDAEEQAYRYALSRAADGGTQLARLRRNFLPEEWDVVVASVLNRMGIARPGGQDATGEVFSVSTFMTNWNKLSTEAKEALFGGNRYRDLRPELDKLVEAISSLKGLEKFTNTSNTSNNLIAFSVLQAGVGALGGWAAGQDPSMGAIAGLVAPPIAAKLITSPAFVKWLATPITSPNGVAAHIGRLTAIMVAEPDMKDEIQQFTAALRDLPSEMRDKTRRTVKQIQGTPAEVQ